MLFFWFGFVSVFKVDVVKRQPKKRQKQKCGAQMWAMVFYFITGLVYIIVTCAFSYISCWFYL